MKNLEKKQKKEIIQKILESLKVTGITHMADSFMFKANEKTFEKDFMKALPKNINEYLEQQKLEPKEFNRGLTYSVTNEKDNFAITY
jgi:hypothetical protein